jgi:16S rRNA C1402 (ribose-2'-O) methylase RsmI
MICVAREISKHFEQYITWNLESIKESIKNNTIPMKWEFVIGIYPHYINEEVQIDTFYSSNETSDS